MLTNVRLIGNSRGVLIPAAFLASCQIKDQIDMQLQDGQIVIKPVKGKPRDGWFDAATQSTADESTKEGLDSQTWADAPLTDNSEWTW